MIESLAALLLFLFPLAYSPGPGNLFFAAGGARFGALAMQRANLGYHLATFAATGLVGLGFSGVAALSPRAYKAFEIAGALYVLYLALKLFRAGAASDHPEARPAGMRDGAVLLLLNPKAYVIIALMFSQFLTVGAGAQIMQVLAIAIVFTLNNAVAFTIWTLAGERLSRVFKSPSQARRLNTGFAILLGAVGVWLLVT